MQIVNLRWNYSGHENVLEWLNFRNYRLNLLECFSSKIKYGIKKRILVVVCEGREKE